MTTPATPGVEALGDLHGQRDEVLHAQVARSNLAEGHGLQLGDLLQLRHHRLDEFLGTELWGNPTGCSPAAGVRGRDRAAEGKDRHLGQVSLFVHSVTSLSLDGEIRVEGAPEQLRVDTADDEHEPSPCATGPARTLDPEYIRSVPVQQQAEPDPEGLPVQRFVGHHSKGGDPAGVVGVLGQFGGRKRGASSARCFRPPL